MIDTTPSPPTPDSTRKQALSFVGELRSQGRHLEAMLAEQLLHLTAD